MPETRPPGGGADADADGPDAAASGARQAPVVYITGTRPAAWLPIAQALQGALQASGAVVVPMSGHEGAGGQDGAAAVAADVIAFVDSPQRALAQWVASGDTGTALELLNTWRRSAAELLKRVHRNSGRCLLVDAAEAAAAPDALARTVAQWHALAGAAQLELGEAASPDALCLALARQLCSADAAAADLFEELNAASVLLDGAASPPQAGQAASAAPVDRYRALLAAEKDGAAAKAAVARIQAETAADRAQAEAARQENEQLLLQLHRVQEELERYYLQLQETKDTAVHAAWRGADHLARSVIHLQEQHDRAPHRHLHFAVENLRSGERELPRLEVRLLDHLGRPGIALFSSQPREALASWQATGGEAGRAFMTLVPSDLEGRQRLDRMGTADWQLVNHLAQSIQRWLSAEGAQLGARWQVTAARLCRQFGDLPLRLRYDRLQLERVASEGGGEGGGGGGGAVELDILFGRVSYGELLPDPLRLRWLAAKAGGTAGQPLLRWLRPEEPGNVPLAAWPAGEDGLLAAAFDLPVGRSADALHKRQQWQALSAGDRALVLAVLDALPGAVERLPDSALPGGTERGTWVRQAIMLHKEGRRTLLKLQLRGFVRRLLRRGGRGD